MKAGVSQPVDAVPRQDVAQCWRRRVIMLGTPNPQRGRQLRHAGPRRHLARGPGDDQVPRQGGADTSHTSHHRRLYLLPATESAVTLATLEPTLGSLWTKARSPPTHTHTHPCLSFALAHAHLASTYPSTLQGRSALLLACLGGQLEMAQRLVDEGCAVDDSDADPLRGGKAIHYASW